MNRETILLKKRLNRILFDDDPADEVFIQEKICMPDEAEMLFDKDLLSGRDLLDFEGGLDDDYICIDSILSQQIASYNW